MIPIYTLKKSLSMLVLYSENFNQYPDIHTKLPVQDQIRRDCEQCTLKKTLTSVHILFKVEKVIQRLEW